MGLFKCKQWLLRRKIGSMNSNLKKNSRKLVPTGHSIMNQKSQTTFEPKEKKESQFPHKT